MFLDGLANNVSSVLTRRRQALVSLFLVTAAISANSVLAQSPQLAVANARVNDSVTEESVIESTTAEFYAGASIDNGLSYVSCADPLDRVDLEGSLVVETDHVGSTGNIYILAIVGEESYMLVGEEFLSWDGLQDSLEPFVTKTLQTTEATKILDDVQFGPAGIERGEMVIYIGYELTSAPGNFYYSATPLRVDIVPGAEANRNEYAGVDPCSPYPITRTSAIVYGTGTITEPSVSEFDLLLDLYTPNVDLTGQQVPAMVIIHGGGFIGGSRNQDSLVDYAERFAAQGYLTISIDYRVAPQFPELNEQFATLEAVSEIPEESEFQARGMFSAMEDSLKALDWLESYAAEEGIELSALGLLGGSAGAITSLNIAYALNDYGFGVPEFNVVVNHWGNLLVDPVEGKPTMSADEAALISVHGTNDPTVEYAGTVEVHVRADEIGLVNELITSEGAGHGFGENRLWDSESFEGSGFTKGERVLDFVNGAILSPE